MLSSEEAADRWHEIKPRIEKALVHGIGETTAHDHFLAIMAGNEQLWENNLTFGITRVNVFPRFKQLQIVAATGSAWMKSHPVLEQFAKELECSNMSVWGRPGWERALKPLGYKKAYTVMVKDLGE